MTEDYFKAHLTKSVTEDRDSDPHLRGFWEDEILTFDIVAAIPHEDGIATMHHPFQKQQCFEVLPFTWADLQEEYSQWSELERAA